MPAARKYKHFNYEDRQLLELLWSESGSVAEIAETMQRTRAAIYYELKRGYDGGETEDFRKGYNAEQAQRAYIEGCGRKGWRKGETECLSK
jgi:IS30 family transposase